MNQEQYLQDQAAIERRKRIAQTLMEQGTTPIDTTQIAGGYVVPVSPLTAISKIAQQLSGAYIGKKASQKEATLKAQRLQELGSINFNSSDLPSELVKAGYPEEAIKLQMEKAKQQQTANRYQPTNMVVMGKDNQLHVRRFGSDPSAAVIEDTANVPNDMQYLNNGEQFVPVLKKVVSQNNDIPENIPFHERMTQALGAVESNNNPNAQSPTSTASGPYQFTDGTRNDAGLNGATPGQETAFMNELNKARLSRYQDPSIAILSHNIGLTGADQVAAGKRSVTPQQQKYIDMVYSKMGVDSPLKMKLTPAQALENDPNQKAALAAAAAEAVLPAKAKEAVINSQNDINKQGNLSSIESDKKAYQEQQKSIIDSYNKFNDVKVQIGAFDRAKAAIEDARPLMGTFADTRINLAKAMKTIDGKKNPSLTAVEGLKTNLFQPIMSLLKSVDASPSQQQQTKMEEAFGNPGTDPDALIQKIDDMKQMFLDKVTAHNEMAKKGVESGMKFPVNPIVNMNDNKDTTNVYSQSDLEHTAKIHGITVEEVKKRLGK
jgi:hypothetical protein